MYSTSPHQRDLVHESLDTSETGSYRFAGPIVANIFRREKSDRSTQHLTVEIDPASGKTTYRVFIGYDAFGIVSEQDFPEEATNETKGKYFNTSILTHRLSQKFRFCKPNKLFDVTKIDRNIKLKDFRNLRKKQYVPIEDYIFQERYE